MTIIVGDDESQTRPRPRRTNGVATVLAIGTANPPNEFYQSDYPDFYFRATNSEHMVDLKERFKRMCEKTKIKKRYMHISDEEILKQHPNLCDNNSPSLNTRQDIQETEIPKLGKEAAMKAIQEWGQPISNITHLIFCTCSPINIPGPDYHLTRLLGLSPSVKRYMLPQQGCYAGGTGLRLAKDLAENNPGARVLVVCAENTVMYFKGPSETHLIPQACLGDGAGAVIVGATSLDESFSSNERPIFELVSAAQTILPNSHGAVESPLQENGAIIRTTLTSISLPDLISNNIENTLVEAFDPLGIDDWNSIFWISHPGAHSIIENMKSKLGLNESKLSAIRHVLSEYGNMMGASVIFVMDEVRKRSSKQGKATTGDGLDWGVLFGFGPGFTVETIVLHSFPL